VAITFAPRSWPSKPTLATNTRTGLFSSLLITIVFYYAVIVNNLTTQM
jgi:hypothetical protein